MPLFRTHDLRRKTKTKDAEPEKAQVEEPKPEETQVVAEKEVEVAPVVESTPSEPAKAPQQKPSRPVRKPQSPRKAPVRKDSDRSRPPSDSGRGKTHSPVRKAEEYKPEPPPARQPQEYMKSVEPMRRAGPVIGITCSFKHRPIDPDHSQRYFFLNQPYVSAIHEAGGVPIIIPVGLEARYPNKILSVIDGLLLPGGGDVDPNSYGDSPHEKLGWVDPRRDHTEIDIFTLVFNQNLPILGICRGLHLMNVALDGTLYQDISSQMRMSLNHNPEYPKSEASHTVDLEPGTRLHKIVGTGNIWVNSSHHQAVKLHGKGLVVNAKAQDGVTEGLEHPGRKWCIGVQWHPELYWRNDREMAKLFKEFVDACK
jgi:putative glutamine amidotransferase